MKPNKPELREGQYVRLKNNNVYKIHKMAQQITIPGNRKSYIDKHGRIQTYTERLTYDTFYIREPKENTTKYEWFVVEETEVKEVYDNLIDCLKKDDYVICDKDLNGLTKLYRVVERVKNKHYDFVACKGHNGKTYIFYRENIKSIKNVLPRSYLLNHVESGSMVRHVKCGWVPVVQVVGGKFVVRTKYGNKVFPRSEFVEVRE